MLMFRVVIFYGTNDTLELHVSIALFEGSWKTLSNMFVRVIPNVLENIEKAISKLLAL